MKVCVIKTSSMGDVIHTLPALTDAQRAIPNLSIDWVVEENFAEIPRWHSAVNQIIPIAAKIAFFGSNKKRVEILPHFITSQSI